MKIPAAILERFPAKWLPVRVKKTLSRARSFALEQLISLHCASGDIRWSMAALAARCVTAVWALLAQSLARPDIATADTMVAAGGR